jgi:inorganic phosphate transporter, PiT family
MADIPIVLVVIIIIALIFDYSNGAHDSANTIASVVSTRVLTPKTAVVMAGVLNFVGAFMGTHVAETIGKGIVNTDMTAGSQGLIVAALCGAIFWNFLTLHVGIPSSSSYALIGGLIGAGVVNSGWNSLEYAIIFKRIIVPLFLSPVAGFIAGYFLMLVLASMTHKFRYKPTNDVFKKLQILSAGFMALTHGMNDAQKTMGIISLALLIFHEIPTLYVPAWVKGICAVVIMLGTINGGWKIIRTMGQKFFKLHPVHGFAAQTATAGVILSASLTGAPISTTQVISSSILGVGSSKRVSAVRWGVAGNMVAAWFITIPASALVGALAMLLLKLLPVTMILLYRASLTSPVV